MSKLKNPISMLMHKFLSARRSYKKHNDIPTQASCNKIIHYVSKGEFDRLMAMGGPRCLLLYKENDKWIAVDNIAGNARTEKFLLKQKAIDWLSHR